MLENAVEFPVAGLMVRYCHVLGDGALGLDQHSQVKTRSARPLRVTGGVHGALGLRLSMKATVVAGWAMVLMCHSWGR